MMAAPNVWTQMNYVPPRGQCNHKQSVISPRCPCLRFMLHPLKCASSYECDGCGHHASFHSMENKVEDEIKKKWEQEAKDKKEEEEGQQRPKKRVRAIEFNTQTQDTLGGDQLTRRPTRALRKSMPTKASTMKLFPAEGEDVVELD